MKYEISLGQNRMPIGVRLGRRALQWVDLILARGGSAWWYRLRGFHGPLLATVLALLAYWLYWQREPVTIDPQVAASAALPEAAGDVLQEDALVQRSALHVFNQSQLFEPRQRPRRRPAATRNVTLAELSRNLQLQAVIGGSSPRAVIQNRETNQAHQVGAGQFIGEIEVIEIGTTTVVLRWKEETLELSL